MYILPSKYKCVKCDYEFDFSPHELHSSPVLGQVVETERLGIQTKSIPVCPNCWGKFLQNNIGLAYSTEVWSKDGSDYEIEKRKLK